MANTSHLVELKARDLPGFVSHLLGITLSSEQEMALRIRVLYERDQGKSAEREACALEADRYAHTPIEVRALTAQQIAIAIRARGKEK